MRPYGDSCAADSLMITFWSVPRASSSFSRR